MQHRETTLKLDRSFAAAVSLLLSLLILRPGPTGATASLIRAASPANDFSSEPGVTEPRRVNAPRFDEEVIASQSSVFWFGRVTPTENSVDVRVGYNDDHLRIRVAVFDRRLWYDTSPSPEDLIQWDAITLYLDRDGNVGNTPDASSYRFDAQLVWWEWEERADWEAAYRGDGSGWERSPIPFTIPTGYWSGNAPNDGEDDRGWWLTYEIPFDSLGLSGAPAQGTVWGMGLAVHDRDDSSGTPIPDQVWPETLASQQPSSWGQLAFGMRTFSPEPAVPGGTVTIRQGLDGATVPDADVGGSSVCGQPAAPDYFPTWGELNYAGKEFVNIQNLFVGDWPCFSKVYVTFPLGAVPAEKVITSATLTLYLFGSAGAGYDPAPQPSLIHALTVDGGWNESTITWNNAPLAGENVAATWVEPVAEYADPPIPHEWDVTGAAAEAYALGQPLRLALYEADLTIHSGKYFHSSDTDDWHAEARPTLTVTWGRALADVDKSATPPSGDQGTSIAYTLSFLGSGNTLTLTDTLPFGVGEPEGIHVEPTDLNMPKYNDQEHRLIWNGTPSMGEEVVIRYRAAIVTGDSEALVNTVELSEAGGDTSTAPAIVIANPKLVYLPLVFREN